MNPKPYLWITAIIFSLVSIAHLARLIRGFPIHVGSHFVPVEISWVGLAVTAVLAAWGFRLALK